MKTKVVIKDFIESLGRAKDELAKSILWRGIKRRFAPKQINICNKKREPREQDSLNINTPSSQAHVGEERIIDIVVSKSCDRTAAPIAPSYFIQTSELVELIEKIGADDLKSLLKDRIDEIEECIADFEKQALCALSLIDEINIFINAYKENDRLVLQEIQENLRQTLIKNNCEILDSDAWNPELQRAIRIDYSLPEKTTPIIIEKVSTGLKVNNKLIKKQEVALQKSIIS